MTRQAIIALALATLAAPAAQALDLPAGSTLVTETIEALGSQRLPAGPFANGEVATLDVDGAIRRQAWRLQSGGLTTLQILAPLREQLAEDGYSILYECREETCGGFDFRYALDLLPEPDMHVDLGNYRYLLASGPEDQPQTLVALVVSSDSEAGFVHVTSVSAASDLPRPASPEAAPEAQTPAPEPGEDAVAVPAPLETGALVERLLRDGHAVLDGLEFGTGSADLGAATSAGLTELAAYLVATPAARVVLVGHTDAVGSLQQNTDLSRRRAEAVRQRLLGELGVPAGQVEANGAGYLAPRATNATPEGRALNRRVEVVLLTTE